MNVVITGSSRGIGLEFVHHCTQQSHKVMAILRHLDPLHPLHKLKQTNPIDVVEVDIQQEGADHLISQALAQWSSVDLLIHNAGVYKDDKSIKDFMDSFHVNAVAPFFITQALLPYLKKSPSPKVVHITSLMGSIADNTSGGSYSYRASKSALNMISKTIAQDEPWLISVAIHPGWVKTEMGGPQAPTTVQESVGGMWKLIETLKPSQTGGFFDFEGDSLPW